MAFDAFLKIDGIDGESTDDKHKGEIEVLSFSWGASQPGNVAGSVTREAKVSISGFNVVKKMDQASPQLMSYSCRGGAFPSAVLSVRKAGENPQEFLKFTLSDVLISNISAGGTKGSDDLPLEQLSFNFSKIEVAYYSSSGQTFFGGCGDAFLK